MNERIEQIRERLQAATPGPWEKGRTRESSKGDLVASFDIETAVFPTVAGYSGPIAEVGGGECDDATFIAHAPEDITFLLAQLQQAQAEAAGLRERVGESQQTLFCGPHTAYYTSIEASEVSAAITRLHASNRAAGSVLRRMFNDFIGGKAFVETNALNPAPLRPTEPQVAQGLPVEPLNKGLDNTNGV
ncbi:hypothetical protein [Hymenobacter tenuis]